MIVIDWIIYLFAKYSIRHTVLSNDIIKGNLFFMLFLKHILISQNHFIRDGLLNVECARWERVTLLTELLFGFIKAFLPARTLVRLCEHDGYVLDPGSANKVHRCNVSHVATAIESAWFRDPILSTCGGNVIENDPLRTGSKDFTTLILQN